MPDGSLLRYDPRLQYMYSCHRYRLNIYRLQYVYCMYSTNQPEFFQSYYI